MRVVYQIPQAESPKLPPGAPQSPNPHRGSGRKGLPSSEKPTVDNETAHRGSGRKGLPSSEKPTVDNETAHRGSGRKGLPSSEKLDLAISLENNYFLIKGLSAREARDITSFVYNSTLPADQLENQLRARFGEKLESISTLPPGAQPVPNLSRNVGLPSSEPLRSPALPSSVIRQPGGLLPSSEPLRSPALSI
jgi:hypothetical protein